MKHLVAAMVIAVSLITALPTLAQETSNSINEVTETREVSLTEDFERIRKRIALTGLFVISSFIIIVAIGLIFGKGKASRGGGGSSSGSGSSGGSSGSFGGGSSGGGGASGSW